VDSSIVNAALFNNSRVFTTPEGQRFPRATLDAAEALLDRGGPVDSSAAAARLAACGGGSDGPAAPPVKPVQPTIVSLGADKAAYVMGERAQLTPVFSGGSGRIEPGIGTVQSGVAVTTAALDGDVTYRLIVEAPGRPAASRALALAVSHRYRLVEVGTEFLQCPGFSRIVARCLDATAGETGIFSLKSAHIIALPAVNANRDLCQCADSCLGIDTQGSIAIPGKFILGFYGLFRNRHHKFL
jgi:hypothetical protein